MALQRGTGLIFDTLLQRDLSTIAVIGLSENPNHITVSLIKRNDLFLYFSQNRKDAIYFTGTIDPEHIEESKSSMLKNSKGQSIDVFILDNIVLKWSYGNSKKRGKDLESTIFEFCKRSLSPNGMLAVTWENRWSTQNIRRILRFRSKRGEKIETLNRHSYWSMRRKIQRVGFSVASTHAVFPDLKFPHRLIATARSCARLFYNQSGSQQYSKFRWLVISLANLLNIRPYLEPGFVLVARA